MQKQFTKAKGAFMKNTVLSFALLSSTISMSTEPEMNKSYISDAMVQSMCMELYEHIKKDDYCPELLIGVSRGGLVPLAHLAGEKMFNNRNTRVINVRSYNDDKKRSCVEFMYPVHTQELQNIKNILVVDDLVDSGNTMDKILTMLRNELPKATIKVATLYYKPTSMIIPDYFVATTEDWIVFPWEK